MKWRGRFATFRHKGCHYGESTLTDVDGDTLWGTYSGQAAPTINCPDPVAGDCVLVGFARFTIDGCMGALSTIIGSGKSARIMIRGADSEFFFGGEIVSQGVPSKASTSDEPRGPLTPRGA